MSREKARYKSKPNKPYRKKHGGNIPAWGIITVIPVNFFPNFLTSYRPDIFVISNQSH